VLNSIDQRWREHLDNMDYMRQGIGLRGYAQKDPLVEYRAEGQEMFGEMSFLIKQEVVRTLMYADVDIDDGGAGAGQAALPAPHAPRGGLHYEHADASTLEALATGSDQVGEPIGALPVVEQRQVDPALPGRNDPCWCGSGKKFKRCHGA
jgi:preprotein translocase subunit SecA